MTTKIAKDSYGNYVKWLEKNQSNLEIIPKECRTCAYGESALSREDTIICHYDPHSGPHHELYWCAKWKEK